MEQMEIPVELEVQDFSTPPQTTFEVAKRLKAIQYLEREIEKHQQAQSEADDFYRRKIDSIESRIEEIKAYVKAYIEHTGGQSIPTHNGTAYVSTTEKFEWPDDNTLISWAKQNCPEAVSSVEKVNKTILSRYIKDNNKIPNGVSTVRVTSLNIRAPERRNGGVNPG